MQTVPFPVCPKRIYVLPQGNNIQSQIFPPRQLGGESRHYRYSDGIHGPAQQQAVFYQPCTSDVCAQVQAVRTVSVF